MKKVILLILFFPFFLFMFLLLMIAGNEATSVSSANISSCRYSIETTEDERLESERNSVKGQLYDESYTNVVLGIYKAEEYQNMDSIISRVNDLIEYEMVNDRDFGKMATIQAYQFGADYLDWLHENNFEHTLSNSKRYEAENFESEENYSYYLKVMSGIDSDCSMSVDGLPALKPYEVTGWFPTYNQDGTGGEHHGIDLGLVIGTPLYAIHDGEVVRIGTGCENNGYIGNMCGGSGEGNYLIYTYTIDEDVYTVIYYHMNTVEVDVGNQIVQGQQVGTSGNSGNSTGPHLHIEIRKNNDSQRLNPCEVVEGLCEMDETVKE